MRACIRTLISRNTILSYCANSMSGYARWRRDLNLQTSDRMYKQLNLINHLLKMNSTLKITCRKCRVFTDYRDLAVQELLHPSILRKRLLRGRLGLRPELQLGSLCLHRPSGPSIPLNSCILLRTKVLFREVREAQSHWADPLAASLGPGTWQNHGGKYCESLSKLR
jgi:hypothetical protein